MAYCDPKDLGRFGVNRMAIEDVQVLDGQKPPIEARADFIDSYLGQRFVLPLLAWGDDLRQCNACLAACDILDVRGRKPGENPEDSTIDKQVDRWLAWLKDIAAGRVTPIVTATPSATPAAQAPWAPRVRSNEPRYADGTFSGRRRSGRTG